jgi:hypothetical protein
MKYPYQKNILNYIKSKNISLKIASMISSLIDILTSTFSHANSFHNYVISHVDSSRCNFFMPFNLILLRTQMYRTFGINVPNIVVHNGQQWWHKCLDIIRVVFNNINFFFSIQLFISCTPLPNDLNFHNSCRHHCSCFILCEM